MELQASERVSGRASAKTIRKAKFIDEEEEKPNKRLSLTWELNSWGKLRFFRIFWAAASFFGRLDIAMAPFWRVKSRKKTISSEQASDQEKKRRNESESERTSKASWLFFGTARLRFARFIHSFWSHQIKFLNFFGVQNDFFGAPQEIAHCAYNIQLVLARAKIFEAKNKCEAHMPCTCWKIH